MEVTNTDIGRNGNYAQRHWAFDTTDDIIRHSGRVEYTLRFDASASTIVTTYLMANRDFGVEGQPEPATFYTSASAVSLNPALVEYEEVIERGVTVLEQEGVNNWTSEAISEVIDDEIGLALVVVNHDNPELTSRILPRTMDIASFHHLLLKEMVRRDIFGHFYIFGTYPHHIMMMITGEHYSQRLALPNFVETL